MRWLPLVALLAVACGGTEIVAPGQLLVLDTTPGNGAVVPAGSSGVAVLFSAAVDPATLPDALRLEETTPAGSPTESRALRFESYDPATHAAAWASDAYQAGQHFRLTVDSAVLRGADGGRLEADQLRRFRAADR